MTGQLSLVDYRETWGEWTGPHWLVRKTGRHAYIKRTTRGDEEKVRVTHIRDHQEEP